MARSGRRLTMRPGDWKLGLAAGVILVIAIAAIVGATIFGLVHAIAWFVGYLFGHTEVPW